MLGALCSVEIQASQRLKEPRRRSASVRQLYRGRPDPLCRKAKWHVKQLDEASGQGRRREQQGDGDGDLPGDEDVARATLTGRDAAIPCSQRLIQRQPDKSGG